MMTRGRALFLASAAAFVFATLLVGCVRRVPFTPRVREAIGAPERLRELQYYMGNGCRLERVASRTAGQVTGGQVLVQQGKAVAVVNIPRGTPGVATAVAPHQLMVSFEEGAAMAFGERQEEGADSRYYLLGRWDEAGAFHVAYRGVDYVQTSREPCFLLVPSGTESTLVREEHTVGGQRLQ